MKSERYEQLVSALKLAREIVEDRRIEWARMDPKLTPFMQLLKMWSQLSTMIRRAEDWHDNEKTREWEREKQLREIERETACYPLTWEQTQTEMGREEIPF